MGKQRVAQLLTQLKENQTKDLENAAAIYTVAQVAVDALNPAQTSHAEFGLPALPAIRDITKADLIERYGSFNGCRKAARQLGIRFKRTPSWPKLETAFSYQEACQKLMQTYLQAYPNEHLSGVSLDIELQ